MGRLTESDRQAGPLTWGKSGPDWRPLRLVFSTGGGTDEEPFNSLTMYAFGIVARLRLPTRVKPWRQWISLKGYDWARSEGYWDEHRRDYGFSLHDGFLQIFHGAQTHDSSTDKTWCTHLPWTQWRHIRFSLYDADGQHYWTELEATRKSGLKWDERMRIEEACPSVAFAIVDYDGESIKARTRIHEREWRFGTGYFKWLSLFRKPRIRRSLNIEFDKECGPGKGSWKGGTMGTGIDMLPGELHKSAFLRYCDEEHRSKYRPYRVQFDGESIWTKTSNAAHDDTAAQEVAA